jgi:hypothetical protein
MSSLVYTTRKSANYAFFIVIIIFSAIAGLVVTFGNIKLEMLIIGLLFGSTILFIPIEIVYWGMAILCFLIVGQLVYFAGITNANWLPIIIGLVLYFRIPLDYLKSLRDRKAPPLRFPILVVPLYLFIALFIIASVINLSPGMQILVGFKLILPYFSFLFVLLINYTKAIDLLDRLWRKFFVVAIIQIPILLYQFFVIAPTRSNAGGVSGVSDDAMAGGFGGDPMGGGASGAMAYVVVLVLTLYLIMWKNKQTHIVSLVFISIIVILAIMLAEVKVVIMLIPIMVLLAYRKESIKNPVYFILILVFISGFIVGVLIIYSMIHNTISHSNDLAGMFDDAFGYSLSTKNTLIAGRRSLSRIEGLLFWWNQNASSDIIHILFGYGPGASTSLSTIAIGEVGRRYPFNIASSVACVILWDMGLLGFFSYVGMLLLGAWRAFTLTKAMSNDYCFANTVLDVSGIGLILMVIMIPYGTDLMNVSAMQFLLTLMLAYIGVFDMRKQNKYKVALTS